MELGRVAVLEEARPQATSRGRRAGATRQVGGRTSPQQLLQILRVFAFFAAKMKMWRLEKVELTKSH